MKQTTRLFLDDINQCWSRKDLITGIVSSNSYTRDLSNYLAKSFETMEEQSKYLKLLSDICFELGYKLDIQLKPHNLK